MHLRLSLRRIIAVVAVMILCAILAWVYLGHAELTLYVSNQSRATDPVQIQVQVDGTLVVNRDFTFGTGHGWHEFTLSLRPGSHNIVVTSQNGQAELEQSFFVFWPHHWAVVDYWHNPAGHPVRPKSPCFSFHIQMYKLYFM